MTSWTWLPSAALAIVLGLLLPLAARPLLQRAGVLDIPSDRSSHSVPTIRGMGVTTAVAVVAGMAAAIALLPGAGGSVGQARATLGVLAAAAACAAVIGWIEDVRGLRVAVRAGLQLGLGAVATAVLAILDPGQQQMWLIPAGAVAVAAYVNVANFMDGINGISGMHGLVVGVFYAVAGVLTGHDWLVCAGAVLAAAFTGFLPWNLGRNRVFLGDVGSYLLGAAISVTALAAFLTGVPVEYIFSPVLVYLADTFVTFLRRLIAGERWYTPHRRHAYQRLVLVGLSHVQATAVVTAATVATSILGIVAARGPAGVQILASFVCAAVVLAYLRAPAIAASALRRRRPAGAS